MGDMGEIDYSPLGKAIRRLKEGLEALGHEPENTLYRDAVIQRFEFTYGLCASMMERYLMNSAAVTPEQKLTFPSLVRTASEIGLLQSGWDVWFEFRKSRNLTSHVYNEEIAQQVLREIPAFAKEAEFLFNELERRAGHGD